MPEIFPVIFGWANLGSGSVFPQGCNQPKHHSMHVPKLVFLRFQNAKKNTLEKQGDYQKNHRIQRSVPNLDH